MKAPVPEIVLLAAAVICIALSISEGDALITVVLAFPLIASVALIIEGRSWKVPGIVPYLCAVCCVMCTLLSLYVLNWTEDTEMSQSLHSHIEGLVIWTVTYSTAYLLLSAVSIAADSVFNRVLAGALTVFMSIGTISLVWVFLELFFHDDIDTKYRFSMEIAYIFVNGVTSFVASMYFVHRLKGSHWRMCREPAEGSE